MLQEFVKRLSDVFRLAFLVSLLGSALTVTTIVVVPTAGDMFSAWRSSSAEVTLDDLSIRSYVYDSDGELLDVFMSHENREPVPLEDISTETIDAILAIEDANFYRHSGIDLGAVFRAGIENVGAGGVRQGGSTITQQVVKNLVVGTQVSAQRKVQEMAQAKRLERQFTKEEILTIYLNTVFFGQGAYGVQAAAEVYWGLDASQLGWAEAALLAAVISNPSVNNPIASPDLATQQRRIVLNRLAALSYITQDEADAFARAPLPTQINRLELPPRAHFVEEVKLRLLNDPKYLGGTAEERENLVFNGGLEIHTTYDRQAQAQAEDAVRFALTDFQADPRGDPDVTMTLVAVQPNSGAVRAVASGQEFAEVKFNLATQGERQPGSAFKTFVMVTLFEQGYQPDDMVSGVGPCQIPNPGGNPDPYVARNFANSLGRIETITHQVSVSSNCAFLRLGQIAGIPEVVETSQRMGLTTRIPSVISAPLGPAEVHPIDMASAYGSLVADGLLYEPYFIERVVDRQGNVLYDHDLSVGRAVQEEAACLATQVLANNVVNGTGRRNAQLPDQPAAGKTGTTEQSADAWFVGFTPYLSAAVWMGHPAERIPMRGVTGSSWPALAWGRFMTDYHSERASVAFPECPGLDREGERLHAVTVSTRGNPCPVPEAEGETGTEGEPALTGDEVVPPVPVDSNGDGVHDSCESPTNVGGIEPCGPSEYLTVQGEPVELWCGIPVPHLSTVLPVTGECDEGFAAVDSDLDGELDLCVSRLGDEDATVEINPTPQVPPDLN